MILTKNDKNIRALDKMKGKEEEKTMESNLLYQLYTPTYSCYIRNFCITCRCNFSRDFVEEKEIEKGSPGWKSRHVNGHNYYY